MGGLSFFVWGEVAVPVVSCERWCRLRQELVCRFAVRLSCRIKKIAASIIEGAAIHPSKLSAFNSKLRANGIHPLLCALCSALNGGYPVLGARALTTCISFFQCATLVVNISFLSAQKRNAAKEKRRRPSRFGLARHGSGGRAQREERRVQSEGAAFGGVICRFAVRLRRNIRR